MDSPSRLTATGSGGVSSRHCSASGSSDHPGPPRRLGSAKSLSQPPTWATIPLAQLRQPEYSAVTVMVTAEASGTVTVLANLQVQLEVEAAIVWPVTPGPCTTSTVTRCQWQRELELEQPQAERFKFQGSVPTSSYTPALGRLGPDSNTVQ